MKQNIDLDSNEEILDSIPIRPFTILTTTNKRIIGKSMIPIGFNRFEGEILLENIISISFKPAKNFLLVPKMKITYRKNDKEISEISIFFPGSSAFRANFNPKKTYNLILKQLS